MRKILKGMTMITLCVMLVGCGETETKEQTTEESQTVQEVVTEQITNEDIDGFCKPEYEKFNSYASDNGLGGTPIYIEGKVLKQTKTGESTPPVFSIIVEQEDGKRWCVTLISDSEIEGIEGKDVRMFGSYQGYSDVANLPAMVIATEDTSLMDKARVEIEENEEYKTVWSFTDNAKDENETEEENNLNLIFKKEYEIDGEQVGIGLFETNGLLSIYVSSHAKTEEKACIMLAAFSEQFGKLSVSEYSITVSCGDLFAMYSIKNDGSKTAFGTNRDGSPTFSAPDWIVTEFTMSEEEINDFVAEIVEAIGDFGESLGNEFEKQPEETTISQENELENQEDPYWTYSGSGDDIVSGFNSADGISIAHISHNDKGHFAVKAHYDNKYDLLVNTTDPYDGMTLIYPEKEYTFEVKGSGDWAIEVYEMGVTTMDEFSGNGDFVTPIFTQTTDVYEISIKGKGHFAVKGWTEKGYQLLVNTTDEDYSGKVMFKNKGEYAFFEITASGDWEIKPSE